MICRESGEEATKNGRENYQEKKEISSSRNEMNNTSRPPKDYSLFLEHYEYVADVVRSVTSQAGEISRSCSYA